MEHKRTNCTTHTLVVCGDMPKSNKCNHCGRGNGFYGVPNVIMDSLIELNRGQRAVHVKSLKGTAPTTPLKYFNVAPFDKYNQYNKEDFEVVYSDAKFFIIKSYSEDDVHNNVKYNVWANTRNGNTKLDVVYREAMGTMFLFFSVNMSGQFVGVVEMMSRVDLEKSVAYWQHDKWTECFDVKWCLVKDAPNGVLKRNILEDNENKTVTYSRDTKEVRMEQVVQMLMIFKGFVSKTCIFADFESYETSRSS